MTAAISIILMVVGFFFLLTAVVGVLRMPDFFSRLHAVGKCDTLGVGLILGGLVVHEGVSFTSAKILLILIFVSLANPTATHALGRAALRAGLKPWKQKEEE